jgi:hypothetical protein
METKISLVKFDGYTHVLKFEYEILITSLNTESKTRKKYINVFYCGNDRISVINFVEKIKIFGKIISRKYIELLKKKIMKKEF